MMKDVDKFWAWVDERREEVGIRSFRELEKRSGYAPGAIGKRKNAFQFPTVEMAEGMCRALRVSWCELWEKAGFVERIEPEYLTGLDAEIYRALQGVGDDFKQAVLKTIRTWLILYEELKINNEGK